MIKLRNKVELFDKISVPAALELSFILLSFILQKNYGRADEDCRHGMCKNRLFSDLKSLNYLIEHCLRCHFFIC